MGIIFGAGLVLGGMTQPENIIRFLDLAGDWNPALAFVMGGAVLVYLPVYQFIIRKRNLSLLNESFETPAETKVDLKLVSGAALFGIGWGMSGFCPGPAITATSSGLLPVFSFLLAMSAGMVANQILRSKQ